jgi:hypothetical protein
MESTTMMQLPPLTPNKFEIKYLNTHTKEYIYGIHLWVPILLRRGYLLPEAAKEGTHPINFGCQQEHFSARRVGLYYV